MLLHTQMTRTLALSATLSISYKLGSTSKAQETIACTCVCNNGYGIEVVQKVTDSYSEENPYSQLFVGPWSACPT